MIIKDIEVIIPRGESETLEFKRSTGQLPRAGETLCAFLNGSGGQVLFGVSPDGALIGQQVTDKTLREVAETIRKIEPPINIEITRVPIPDTDREILVLTAPVSHDARPFAFAGRPYQRIGTTTSVMPQERYQQILVQRMHIRQRWENTPAEGIELSDLDQEEILRTVRVGISAGRLPEATGTDPGDILNRLGLRVQGKILNAAVVLFGTRFLPDYPQCHLRLARFRGVNKTEFLDNRQLHGHAFQILDEAMLFMQRHLPIAGRIAPGLFERIDEPLFPMAALREALVNAICHRDYTIAGGGISLGIYDDRLEIWSNGTLPLGVAIEDLKKDHISHPRNPLIADTFYRRGLFERWGRGTQTIVELCVRAGHPEPEFLEQAGAVGVRFLPSGYIAPHRVAHDLTPRQREILQVLASVPERPLRDIRQHLEAPPADRTLRDDLAHLKRLELVDSRGFGRGAVWYLVRPDE